MKRFVSWALLALFAIVLCAPLSGCKKKEEAAPATTNPPAAAGGGAEGSGS